MKDHIRMDGTKLQLCQDVYATGSTAARGLTRDRTVVWCLLSRESLRIST